MLLQEQAKDQRRLMEKSMLLMGLMEVRFGHLLQEPLVIQMEMLQLEILMETNIQMLQ